MKRHIAAAVVGVLCVVGTASTAAADGATARAPAFTHLRTVEPYVTELLVGGLQKSPTFNGLIRTIEDSDLLVYVIQWMKLSTFGEGLTVGGNVTVREAANGLRIVFILINPSLPPDHATAMIAHELQHAVEIAQAPHVVDHKSLVQHYRQIGIRTGAQSYDTTAARTVWDRVITELNRGEGAWDVTDAGT